MPGAGRYKATMEAAVIQGLDFCKPLFTNYIEIRELLVNCEKVQVD